MTDTPCITGYRHPGFAEKAGAAKTADSSAALAALYTAGSKTTDLFYL